MKLPKIQLEHDAYMCLNHAITGMCLAVGLNELLCAQALFINSGATQMPDAAWMPAIVGITMIILGCGCYKGG